MAQVGGGFCIPCSASRASSLQCIHMITCAWSEGSMYVDARLAQDNVALIVVLDATAGQGQGQEKPAEAPRRQLICVANTHIHANPELNDVKLWQVNTPPILAAGPKWAFVKLCECSADWRRLGPLFTGYSAYPPHTRRTTAGGDLGTSKRQALRSLYRA